MQPARALRVKAVPVVGLHLPGQRHGCADQAVGHHLEGGKPSPQKHMGWRCMGAVENRRVVDSNWPHANPG